MLYKYTLAFLKRKDEILLLNRNKSPWMGSWNGVGGKLQEGETPLECILREIKEETGIDVEPSKIQEKGFLTWEQFKALGNGLYLFLVELDPEFEYNTPVKVSEGILDFKKIDWITSLDNEGIAKNIPHFLPNVLNREEQFHYHCVFNEKHVLESVSTSLI